MNRAKVLTVLATTAAVVAVPLVANAQIDVYVSPVPAPVIVQPVPQYGYDTSRHGAFGDKDRDGIPNIADNYNNNRDRRGPYGDRDGDGVPNRWDDRPNNPYRH